MRVAWSSCTSTTEWIDDPSTFYPFEPSCGPGCGNGGGGAPNPNTPPKPTDPCAPSGIDKAFYRMMPGCQGNGNGDDDLPEFDNPCEKLKKMLEVPVSLPLGAVSIKTALKDLQNTVDNSNTDHEEGYNFRYNATNGTMYAQKVTTWSPDDNSVEYERTENTFGGAHFHQKSLQGMFSHADISVLYNFYFWFKIQPYNGINDSNYPQPVHMLVANGQVYALAIEPNDINYFRQTYNDLLNGDEEVKDDFQKNFKRDYSKLFSTVGGWDTDKTKLEKIFLKFVTKIDNSPKHYNLKVSLYRANANLTSWEKLTIKKIGSDYNITPNPCN